MARVAEAEWLSTCAMERGEGVAVAVKPRLPGRAAASPLSPCNAWVSSDVSDAARRCCKHTSHPSSKQPCWCQHLSALVSDCSLGPRVATTTSLCRVCHLCKPKTTDHRKVMQVSLPEVQQTMNSVGRDIRVCGLGAHL